MLGEELPYYEYLPEVLKNYCRCVLAYGSCFARNSGCGPCLYLPEVLKNYCRCAREAWSSVHPCVYTCTLVTNGARGKYRH